MHELSIANSLIELVEDELTSSAMREERSTTIIVSKVVIRVGDLSGVVVEALKSALTVAKIGSCLADAFIEIESCPATIWCETCNVDQLLASPQSRRCPVCGELSTRLTGGRELELALIEVVDLPPPKLFQGT